MRLSTDPPTYLIQPDARGRVTIPGIRPGKYRLTEHEGGTLVLEPIQDQDQD